MSETPLEAEPSPVPEPTDLERVAQLAADAVARARPDRADEIAELQQGLAEIRAALRDRPDRGQEIAELQQGLAEIRELLQAAAGPDGNGARLTARLEQLEAQLTALAGQPPAVNPEQQEVLDDLRQKVATLERKNR